MKKFLLALLTTIIIGGGFIAGAFAIKHSLENSNNSNTKVVEIVSKDFD